MRILSLDFSTSTGFAVLDTDADKTDPVLVHFGTVKLDKIILEFGEYPFCYFEAANNIINQVQDLIQEYKPDQIVVEESNLGKNRYSQKALEFMHCLFAQHAATKREEFKVAYLSSSAWRQALQLQLSKEQKKANAKLAKAKKDAANSGTKLDKKQLGVKGKVTKKHVAIEYANGRFGLNLRAKDDDIADAICIAAAFVAGAVVCDGT